MDRVIGSGRIISEESFLHLATADRMAQKTYMELEQLFGGEPYPAILTVLAHSLIDHFDRLELKQRLFLLRTFEKIGEPYQDLLEEIEPDAGQPW